MRRTFDWVINWIWDNRRWPLNVFIMVMNLLLAGVIFRQAWQWFMVTPYGLPALRLTTGGVIWLTIRMLSFTWARAEQSGRDERSTLRTMWDQLSFWLMLFFTFWVVHFFR